MAPKTRFGVKTAPTRGKSSTSSSKRTRAESESPPQRASRRTTSSTLSSEEPSPSQSIPCSFRDAIQRKSYEQLALRELMSTRFIDERALELIGISGEVTSLLEGFGWSRFRQLKCPTYRELTLEFLSSFNCDMQTWSPTSEGNITFRLMGEERRHTLATFNALFGCPLDGIRFIEQTEFSAENAWCSLTGLDGIGAYNPRFSKASHLTSPSLRYLHRFLAHSIFGRGESTGVVRRDELFFLWAMTQEWKLNVAVWMCEHFQHVKAGKGKICVGGLVTIIAEAYGFVPTPVLHTRIWSNERVDIEMLVLMGLCRKEQGEYFLLSKTGELIPKRSASAPSSSAERRSPPIIVRDTIPIPRPPRFIAKATASGPRSAHATASASASAHHTTQEAGSLTMEMVVSRLEQRMEQMEMRMMSRFDQLDSRVGILEKKIDATEWSE